MQVALVLSKLRGNGSMYRSSCSVEERLTAALAGQLEALSRDWSTCKCSIVTPCREEMKALQRSRL